MQVTSTEIYKKIPKIAVLRGGTNRHKESIASGYGVLDSLSRVDVPTVDVYIDEKGIWHTRGIESDAHKVFAHVDGYVDTTEDVFAEAIHGSLAKRMGIEKVLSHKKVYELDRESTYRLLRQGGVSVPETEVIRVKLGVPLKTLQEVWRSLHTPYIVRPISHTTEHTSVFVSSFDDFREVAKKFSEEYIDFHVVPYRSEQTISTALLPDYRGERVYLPLSVTTLTSHREVPNADAKIITYRTTKDSEYDELHAFLRKTYEILGLNGPALVDVIKTKVGYMVVEVKTQPSLRSEGRFMQSLATTGVELGHYISTRFE
jgi:carbamoylphosphate synthase large subunit